ncbi:expressed unknown protein [Seminavis robusta]|uniref:Uncharacterized protein n=1 Tax=Seminavis robusta TaxID=568900 RepID=A0A9N8HMX1_9STRA|nr:expressed unknown protein [Seminavis robusta]|eukprot:Sro1034_g233860.1 n/a (124) ;mRNA; f:24388-24988
MHDDDTFSGAAFAAAPSGARGSFGSPVVETRWLRPCQYTLGKLSSCGGSFVGWFVLVQSPTFVVSSSNPTGWICYGTSRSSVRSSSSIPSLSRSKLAISSADRCKPAPAWRWSFDLASFFNSF